VTGLDLTTNFQTAKTG